jgi:threonine/homoserine/homoserine lactone efflux protein
VAPRRELSLECNTLELTNGKATSLMGLADNEISTNSYLSNNVLLRLLFKLLNPCPLSLIGTILTAAMLPHSQAYPLWMFLAEFALVLLLIVVKEVYFDMMRRRADEKINRSKLLMKDSKVYRDG